MICASSKATPCSNATVPTTLTGSPPKACRWRSCSCSSTSNSAAPSPTAGSITSPIPATSPTANSKPPTTRQTRPFSKSLTCLPRRDVTYSSPNVELFLIRIFNLRIYTPVAFLIQAHPLQIYWSQAEHLPDESQIWRSDPDILG